MYVNKNFSEIFGKLPIIGMLHLAGENPVERALEELKIYEEKGVDGAIVENYVGSIDDVEETLKAISELETKVTIGVNVLPNQFIDAFRMARKHEAKFIQLDYVAGRYLEGFLDSRLYRLEKSKHPEIVVLGGVHPKYYTPFENSVLKNDIFDGKMRAEALVVTGKGTGIETSLEKIKLFREYAQFHDLIVGAGVNHDNVRSQLKYVDGAIVGSCFKLNGNINAKVNRELVHAFMELVKPLRTR